MFYLTNFNFETNIIDKITQSDKSPKTSLLLNRDFLSDNVFINYLKYLFLVFNFNEVDFIFLKSNYHNNNMKNFSFPLNTGNNIIIFDVEINSDNLKEKYIDLPIYDKEDTLSILEDNIINLNENEFLMMIDIIILENNIRFLYYKLYSNNVEKIKKDVSRYLIMDEIKKIKLNYKKNIK